MDLTPQEIVERLDRYIVGQKAAKRAVAVALRNRFRRRQLPPDLQEEILPKNILMIGPTGVGKTEIARRLAKLANAPFIKIEATKFTEVGYVGRDVESMVRDLVETAIRIVKTDKVSAVQDRAEELAQERLLDYLCPLPQKNQNMNPLGALFGMYSAKRDDEENFAADLEKAKSERRQWKWKLDSREIEDKVIEIEVEDNVPQMLEVFSGAGVEEMGINLQDVLGGMLPKRKRKRKLTVAEARRVLVQEEAQKLIDMDEVTAEAIRQVEQNGIVFLDEIDKVAGGGTQGGPDVSREGVQRDLLPIIEGTTVMTKYGPVQTDHILFISAGAFHVSKPSDLIPELQGRFPIRVELESLTKEDFERILTEPDNALIKQYTALMATEGINLEFTDEAIEEIARLAEMVNSQTENIGARRLHTILERLLEDLSFSAPDLTESTVRITGNYVRTQLEDLVQDRDLSRYIL